MMMNALDVLIEKNVRVVQKDTYVKYGRFVDYNDDFVKLLSEDGKITFIAINSIASIGEWENGH